MLFGLRKGITKSQLQTERDKKEESHSEAGTGKLVWLQRLVEPLSSKDPCRRIITQQKSPTVAFQPHRLRGMQTHKSNKRAKCRLVVDETNMF